MARQMFSNDTPLKRAADDRTEAPWAWHPPLKETEWRQAV